MFSQNSKYFNQENRDESSEQKHLVYALCIYLPTTKKRKITHKAKRVWTFNEAQMKKYENQKTWQMFDDRYRRRLIILPDLVV